MDLISKIPEDWLEFVEHYKEDLALDVYPFDDIDLAMMFEVLTWKGIKTPKIVQEFIKRQEVPSADELEFIGDAVLHIIFTMSVANHRLSVGQMSRLRSELERNSNLFKYSSELGLCKRDRKIAMKDCADI